jgi:hypothetical protein
VAVTHAVWLQKQLMNASVVLSAVDAGHELSTQFTHIESAAHAALCVAQLVATAVTHSAAAPVLPDVPEPPELLPDDPVDASSSQDEAQVPMTHW